MKPNIELHIEKIVLHGFDPADSEAIGEAVRLELTRLLGQHGLPQTESVGLARLDGGTLTLEGAPAVRIGGQVARAVYRSLGGTTGGEGDER